MIKNLIIFWHSFFTRYLQKVYHLITRTWKTRFYDNLHPLYLTLFINFLTFFTLQNVKNSQQVKCQKYHFFDIFSTFWQMSKCQIPHLKIYTLSAYWPNHNFTLLWFWQKSSIFVKNLHFSKKPILQLIPTQ